MRRPPVNPGESAEKPRKPVGSRGTAEATHRQAEVEGLEPQRACARRILSTEAAPDSRTLGARHRTLTGLSRRLSATPCVRWSRPATLVPAQSRHSAVAQTRCKIHLASHPAIRESRSVRQGQSSPLPSHRTPGQSRPANIPTRDMTRRGRAPLQRTLASAARHSSTDRGVPPHGRKRCSRRTEDLGAAWSSGQSGFERGATISWKAGSPCNSSHHQSLARYSRRSGLASA